MASEIEGVKRIAYRHYKGKVVMVVGFSKEIVKKQITSTKEERIPVINVIFRPIDESEGMLSHKNIKEFKKRVVYNGELVPMFAEFKPEPIRNETRSKKAKKTK